MDTFAYPGPGIGKTWYGQQFDQPANPAAGAQWSDGMAQGFFYQLLVANATFTTSANVANRNVGVDIFDGVNLLFRIMHPTSIAASQAFTVSIATGVGAPQLTASGSSAVLFIPPVWLANPCVIRTFVNGMQANDQWSAINVLWRYIQTPKGVTDPTL